MQKINFTETVLRDANQSLIATRLPFSKMEPILDRLDKAGYYSIEAWGGATFDACLRFLNEDPWVRLKNIKKYLHKTKIQMLLRGQNILGYKHYHDDVVRLFIYKAVENGVDIIRVFDALNDMANVETAMKAIKAAGAHAQGAISYTISPVHDTGHFIKTASIFKEMGADSICIKDMSGLILPGVCRDLVKALKSSVGLPVFLHSHCTTGIAPLSYMEAVKAGVDGIDTALAPFSMGSSQPATESMYYSFSDMGYDTGLDIDVINSISEYFLPIKDEYIKSGLLDPKVLGVDANVLKYQIPGGMLSNMISQLKQQNAAGKLSEVLKEIPRVREDLGYPPLVTPTSQIVGTQAVLNVLTGERYKAVIKEVKAYLKGEYGKAPGVVNEALKNKMLGGEKPYEGNYKDSLKPALESAKKELGTLAQKDEDVLSYILFPQIAKPFLEKRKEEFFQSVYKQINIEGV
ncbi:methylmalonyl-CoA carboxyltransferase 5S subunit [Oxobacter pfennigii]|uniref:Methylmalonyl-CoA carboxyltransferase 5S subunit n=1 Tax=Oxobacter pfennigii TaxID=36849 RepID=A0A0N8NU11_9CLOT|nr:pyruvate carboxylase subunit B [Oxobacter pfennigii]KPU46336.1 methylmalonyl-CoA carboxyltransferase 5S subunit [Oxobacter pfennigii]